GQLTDLGLTGNSFTVESVRALASCPRLANLRKLRLGHNNGLREGALAALAPSPYLVNLEDLEWNGGFLQKADAEAILASPHLRKLRCLYGVSCYFLSELLRERMRERFRFG
ncbi:MAG TPA: hypothetical protein VFE78_31665, partial [Gemmataceae bacterium]|nr:hypothetical protein [Gemmataceae bacterium]